MGDILIKQDFLENCQFESNQKIARAKNTYICNFPILVRMSPSTALNFVLKIYLHCLVAETFHVTKNHH